MKRTTQENVKDLEQRLLSLTRRIREAKSHAERNQIQEALWAIEVALTKFRAKLESESGNSKGKKPT